MVVHNKVKKMSNKNGDEDDDDDAEGSETYSALGILLLQQYALWQIAKKTHGQFVDFDRLDAIVDLTSWSNSNNPSLTRAYRQIDDVLQGFGTTTHAAAAAAAPEMGRTETTTTTTTTTETADAVRPAASALMIDIKDWATVADGDIDKLHFFRRLDLDNHKEIYLQSEEYWKQAMSFRQYMEKLWKAEQEKREKAIREKYGI